ncbi:unnamed protein product [Camellia sinensis]
MEVDPRDHRNKEEKIASISPWKRKHPETWGPYKITMHSFWEKFDDYTYANMDLDIDTKKTALKASPSVVSVVSLTGGNALFMGSGTIIDCENVNSTYFSTILTSASLLRSSAELEAVPEDIKMANYYWKTISIDPNDIPGRPHSNVSKLCPGDNVVAVGRFFDAPYNLMAARGQFRAFQGIATGQSKWEICPIAPHCFSWNVVGKKYGCSMLVNKLMIVISLIKKEKEKQMSSDVVPNFCRPLLGMEMTNLYAASVDKLERIIQKFPNIVKGVLVEKFYGIIWDKVGKYVEVVVIRERSDALLNLTMVVDETSADKFNRWPLPKRSMQPVGRIRFR